MADESITACRVSRYRPDTDAEPHWQEYDVPLRKEWTVLDGLNHVKNEVDTTLSFRWSCRMGICGSCGMNVDGEPKLTCGTFLTDYAPGPGHDRAARELPRRAGPRRRPDRLHGEAAAGQAVDHPRGRPPDVEPDGEYLQTPGAAGRLQAVQHVHQLHALLRRLPGLRPRPGLHRPGGHRARRAVRPRLARPRAARERLDVLIEHDGVWGCTFVGECTRVCPKHVDPASAIQRYKLKAALETVKAFLLPRGATMIPPGATTTGLHALPAPHLDLVVDQEAHLLRVRDARAEQRLHRLVRGLPAAVRLRRRPGRGGLPALPRLGLLAVGDRR